MAGVFSTSRCGVKGQRTGQQQQGRQQGQQQQGETVGRGNQQQRETSGRVTLTNEQQARIRENIFVSNRNVPRVDRVNFSIRVGAVVPSRVRVVEVPSVLIDIHPEWRSYLYFVAEDEIFIMDRGRRIVATVPVGQSNVQLNRPGTGGGSVAVG